MDFIFYEGILMSVTKLKMPDNAKLSQEMKKIGKKSKNIAEIKTYPLEMKAPDCVYQTIVNRMDELNKEISEYEDILRKLKGEYKAHANFILNSPFAQRNLSQCSDNND